jgi:hypothetical protein
MRGALVVAKYGLGDQSASTAAREDRGCYELLVHDVLRVEHQLSE